MKKAIIALLAVLLVVGLGYYAFSRYLVSRLDGTGGITVPVPEHGPQQYNSEEGFSFAYPDTYELSSRAEADGTELRDTLVLLPKGYVPPQDGEGPPAITVSSYSNIQGLSLEKFITSEPKTNFNLSGGALASTTIGGLPAVSYTHSGLYEYDAVAVSYADKVYIFEAGHREAGDPIRQDFQNLLTTVQFTHAR